MLTVRLASERGQGRTNWLESWHTFSFADYYDAKHMHFSHLRVINEDFIAGGHGFGMHPHKDMEILTYVLSGSVAHKDSMGNSVEVKAGEFQIMSAGSGIYHSEVNPNPDEMLHLYQIWILPNQKDITPRYAQKAFAEHNGGTLILSPTAEQGSFKVYQDMWLWRWQLTNGQQVDIPLQTHRRYWLQMTKGEIHLADLHLVAGDGLAISQEQLLSIIAKSAVQNSEFLLFDLA